MAPDIAWTQQDVNALTAYLAEAGWCVLTAQFTFNGGVEISATGVGGRERLQQLIADFDKARIKLRGDNVSAA